MRAKKDTLKLHTQPKQTTQVNRPLIITITLIVVSAISLAIIGAFTTSKHSTSSSKVADEPKVAKAKSAVISPELKALPQDYQDVGNIKRFFTNESEAQLALILQKFDRLQHDYLLLKRQLANQNVQVPKRVSIDPMTQQAKKSDVVFSEVSSSADGLIGSGSPAADRSRSPLSRSRRTQDQNQTDLVATPQQEKLFREQKRNEQKLAVMKGPRNETERIYEPSSINYPISPYQIQAGTLIPATLITGIDSTLVGTIIAQVRSNLYDTVTGKYLLIPRGSKLLGRYSSRVATGQRRVLLTFDRIIRPDGSSVLLGSTNGVDLFGKSGIEGNVNNHWGRILGAATISTVLSVGAGVAEGGSSNEYTNARTRSLRGATQGFSDVGRNIVNRSLAIRPTITLSPGDQFNVAVNRDIVLTPYKPKTY